MMFGAPPALPPLAVGQRLACESQHAGRKLEVIVGNLESWPMGTVVNVSLIDATPGAVVPGVDHMPFTQEVIRSSCPTLLKVGEQITAEFTSGIAEWRAAKGGVFTISVDKAYDIVLDQVAKAGGRTQ